MYTVIYGLVWFIVTGVSPWQAGRHMMAKSEHVALRSGIVGCVCATVVLVLLHLVTISLVNVDATMEPERAIVWGFANLAPVLIGSVALAGIVAAGLSSAVTFLSIIGFSITNDLFDFKFKDDKDKLFKSRMIMLGAGVVALILALCNLGGIRVIAWLASTIIASSWCVVSYGGIWSKRLSSRGALWSMIAGFVGFVVTKFLQGFGVTTVFSNFLDPFFIGIYLSILFAVIGSATKAPSPKEIAYREKLLIVPKSELDPREYKITYRYTTMSIIVGVAFTAFLVFYWVLPYNGGHL
jgi:sodium/pantothenate symporter